MKKSALTIIIIAGILSICAAETENQKKKNVSMNLSIATGITVADIHADSALYYYFNPTSKVQHIISPYMRIEFEVTFFHCVGITIGLHGEKVGQYSEKTRVEIPNDPFVHDFESRAEIVYASVPINIKLGYYFQNHWAVFRFGPVFSYKAKDKLEWKIDDIVNTKIPPQVEINDTDMRILYGIEYGFIIRKNGIFCSANYQHGIYDIIQKSSTSGRAYNRLWNYCLGYKRFF